MTNATPSTLAERNVIGEILNDNSVVGIARSKLKVEEFYFEANRRIFETICALNDDGMQINVATIFSRLGNDPSFIDAGGIFYLTNCSNDAVSSTKIDSDAAIVHDDYIRRQLGLFADRIRTMVDSGIPNIGTTLSSLSGELVEMSATTSATPWHAFNDSLESICAELVSDEPVETVDTGFVDLDAKLSGLRPGLLTIIAARPAMGKTALGLNIASNVVLDQKKPCAFFSLEMTAKELAIRIVCSRAKVNSLAVRKKLLDDAKWNQFMDAVDKCSTAPLFIDETSGLDINVLCDRARRLCIQQGIKIIIIDYLQLITCSNRKVNNREQEIGTISRTLKALSKELHIPIIVLSQLNRNVDGRADKRPLLCDLRESGSIEQDADTVIFIHREDYYAPNAQPTNVAEIIIAKQRGGPTGIVKLHWNGDFTLFSNLEMW